MGMLEAILKDHVFIDFDVEVLFGSDQVYVDYPCRFATVEFQLTDTNLLSGIVDRIRKEQGFIPFHPIDEYTDEMCDQDGEGLQMRARQGYVHPQRWTGSFLLKAL